MVKKRIPLNVSVVEAARQRIINVCNQGVPVYVSVSGGKDSLVLSHLVLDLLREGKIRPDNLTAIFIDEEAMFDSVIESTKNLRKLFLSAGVTFKWYCIEVTHYNCFNTLKDEETFICWDSTITDRWVRPMPPFAVTDHPLLKRRKENYQSFSTKAFRDGVVMTGLRTSESVQRLNGFNSNWSGSGLFWPIYDWKDADIWRYLRDNSIEFPETYLHMYQIGRSRKEMRISQFFSIDTAKSLVRLNEHEPELMERITRREPNAYLAAMYWDTEMFRSAGGSGHSDGKKIDFESRVREFLYGPIREEYDSEFLRLRKVIRRLRVQYPVWDLIAWKSAYEILVSGDPKDRTRRALGVRLTRLRIEETSK